MISQLKMPETKSLLSPTFFYNLFILFNLKNLPTPVFHHNATCIRSSSKPALTPHTYKIAMTRIVSFKDSFTFHSTIRPTPAPTNRPPIMAPRLISQPEIVLWFSSNTVRKSTVTRLKPIQKKRPGDFFRFSFISHHPLNGFVQSIQALFSLFVKSILIRMPHHSKKPPAILNRTSKNGQ